MYPDVSRLILSEIGIKRVTTCLIKLNPLSGDGNKGHIKIVSLDILY